VDGFRAVVGGFCAVWRGVGGLCAGNRGGDGAAIVNADEQAAQRARWPIILSGTASFEPQPGQATTVVSD
jgi:hypothetical protein